MIWALPDDAINTLLVLMDGPESVAGLAHAGVCQKLTLCHEFHSVLSHGGGQCQIPQSPLLDKILWLLRNDRRVHQVSG